MKWVQPSPSFEVLVPDSVVSQADGRVFSLWMEGGPVALQLSSYLYVNTTGRPMDAMQRLNERISASAGRWKIWEHGQILIDGAEVAVAETIPSDGLLWVYAYVVWPHLTVFATISGPERDIRNPQNWAIAALKTLKLNLQ